jgi:endoglucanase
MAYTGTGVNGMSFTYWSWNPNSGDTGGIANDDWTTINQAKQSILQPYLIAPVGGGTSSPTVTPTGSTTPTPPATGGCTATYKQDNAWQGGFQGKVEITNTATKPLDGWTLKWSFANGQVVSSLWNGVVTQSGAAVSVANAAWNRTIAAGSTVEVGFTASRTGTNGKPTAFTVNGKSCT